MAVLFDLASEVNKSKSTETAGLLKALGACLGLLQQKPKSYLQGNLSAGLTGVAAVGAVGSLGVQISPASDVLSIDSRIAQRAAAKAAKNFAEADRIRKELQDQGIVLKDSPTGTTWEMQ
jgi:cysteinyl-tRNA synthetase